MSIRGSQINWHPVNLLVNTNAQMARGVRRLRSLISARLSSRLADFPLILCYRRHYCILQLCNLQISRSRYLGCVIYHTNYDPLQAAGPSSYIYIYGCCLDCSHLIFISTSEQQPLKCLPDTIASHTSASQPQYHRKVRVNQEIESFTSSESPPFVA